MRGCAIAEAEAADNADGPPRLLRMQGVGHRFGEGAWLFRDVNTDLQGGRSYALVGPSGSGKSTLLSIVAGVQTPAEGAVNYEAEARLPAGDRPVRRREGSPRISWVFQNPFGVAGRSARDHVMLPILARGLEIDEAATEAEALLAQLRLAHLADREYRELSGGEAQRLMIARGIAARPDVFLVDEPTAQLDRATAAEVNATLSALTDVVRGARTIVVVATHDPETRDACGGLIDLAEFSPARTSNGAAEPR